MHSPSGSLARGTSPSGAGLDITPGRLETLLGGTLVLAEVARRLDTKLEVGRGGLREGAAPVRSRAVESAAARSPGESCEAVRRVTAGAARAKRRRAARGRASERAPLPFRSSTQIAALLARHVPPEQLLEDLAVRADERRLGEVDE